MCSETVEEGCGMRQSIRLQYPLVLTTLAEEINQRAARSALFQEQEVWLLLLRLAEASVQANGQFLPLGDLQTRHVLLSREGAVQVFCVWSMPGVESALGAKLRDQSYSCYLAPEQEIIVRHHNPLLEYD
jgi:hypothetical protein